MKNITVIGGTGMIGRPVVQALHDAGFEVTAFVRDEAKARKLLPAGIHYAVGDLRNVHDVDRALKGQEGIYLNLNLNLPDGKHAWHAEREGIDNIVAAAQKNNIKRIAIISSVVMNYQGMNGFNWWVFDMKKEALEKIRASGIPYTIFYPSTFMENFMTTYRKGNRILLAGTSHHKMYFIAGKDYGQQVARSFKLLNKEKKEYIVQGPEGYTADEATDVFIRNYTREKLTISRAPLALLKFIGIFSNTINYGHNIITALNNYPEKFEAEETWTALGRPATTLADYARTVS
jgi:uncharacterized protein YbjT (DUF2867 family)